MHVLKADLSWMQFGKDIEIAVGNLPPEKTEQQLREEKLAELKTTMSERALGQFGLVADFSRNARIIISIEKARKRKLGEYNEVVRNHAKLMRDTQTVQEFFDKTIKKFLVKPEELMVFNPLDGVWISYTDVLERHPSSALTLAEIRVLKRHTTKQVDIKSVLAKLENDIFDVERFRVSINIKGNFDRRSYKNLWPSRVPGSSLIRNWIIKRLGAMQVRPDEVTFTLPNGKKASGLHLVTTNSKLRIGGVQIQRG